MLVGSFPARTAKVTESQSITMEWYSIASRARTFTHELPCRLGFEVLHHPRDAGADLGLHAAPSTTARLDPRPLGLRRHRCLPMPRLRCGSFPAQPRFGRSARSFVQLILESRQDRGEFRRTKQSHGPSSKASASASTPPSSLSRGS